MVGTARRFDGRQAGNAILSVLMAWALVFGWASTGFGSAPIVVTIPETVAIDDADVILGHLAQVTGADKHLTQQLQAVKIGRGPVVGHSRTISRDYILLRLRQAGYDPALMTINGAEKITLSRRAVKISAEDLEMMVRAYIAANPPFSGAEMTITAVRIPGDVMLPTGDIQHEIHYLQQSRPSGTLPLTISFSKNGHLIKRLTATASIMLMKDVPVTRRPIARYQLIQAEDLMMQAMDVADLPANTVFSFEAIQGMRARRTIRPRTVLRKDQLEYPPAVQKGDRVIIIAASGGLRITTLGEVQHTGKVGDRIRVVNLDSNKTLFARVIDSRTVQVEF
jgi:flagellar basal body P-ring formation protein FlgA